MWSRALSERLAAASAGKRTQNTRTRAMVHAMISHHREWAIFRASLLELFSTDEVVRRARIEERSAHLAMLQHSLGSSLESALLVMWLCERAADGAASGEAEAYLTSAPKLEEALSALIQLAHSPG